MQLRIIRAIYPNEPTLHAPRQILAGMLGDPSSGRLGHLIETVPSKFPLSEELFPEAFETNDHLNQGVEISISVLTFAYRLKMIFGRYTRADARKKKPRPEDEIIHLQNYQRFYDFCKKAPFPGTNDHIFTVQILTIDLEKENEAIASVPLLIEEDDVWEEN